MRLTGASQCASAWFFVIVARAFLLALLTSLSLASAAAAADALPEGWQLETLPGAQPGRTLQALIRTARVGPARYRVVVLPGSGCTGWLPVAERYFSGLLHAEVLVLHKPGVDVNAGLGASCSPDFIQNDALSSWRDDARAALRAHDTRTAPALPVLLLGISEGAELLPDLAAEIPALAGVVMVSASGLDPREAGELQAQRLGQQQAWQDLGRVQSSDLDDRTVVQGRTLRYWRDLWQWPLAQPMLQGRWPLLRVWGDADEAVPLAAYQRFLPAPEARPWPFCDLRLQHANHALQSPARDGLQWLWAQLEIWARKPATGLCEVMPRAASLSLLMLYKK